MVVPDNDERMDKLAHLFHLTDFDIGKFYRLFNKLGKLQDFFSSSRGLDEMKIWLVQF